MLLERGVTVPQGRRKLERYLDAHLSAAEVSLSPRTRLLVEDLRAEWRELDRRISAVRQLRVERDILSRAAAWFARETGAIASGSSGS